MWHEAQHSVSRGPRLSLRVCSFGQKASESLYLKACLEKVEITLVEISEAGEETLKRWGPTKNKARMVQIGKNHARKIPCRWA